MNAYWRDIDLALIQEASKINPDFSVMERFVADGADVNAVEVNGEENALSAVIEGWECDDEGGRDPKVADSLPAVVAFFLRHGFDPSRDDGRAGAKCLTNLTWSPCEESKIPAMKLLLDAGCQNIPPWSDEPDGETPKTTIGGEASFQGVEGDYDSSNTFEALYAILSAREEGRRYSGIERYTFAFGQKVEGVFLTKPELGDPFFSLNEPTSKHDNCFRGSLYFKLEKGWLIEENAVSLFFDLEQPHEDVIDVSNTLKKVVGAILEGITFDKHSIAYGMTHYGQVITHFHFSNNDILTTQTNFGEILNAKMLAYYTLTR